MSFANDLLRRHARQKRMPSQVQSAQHRGCRDSTDDLGRLWVLVSWDEGRQRRKDPENMQYLRARSCVINLRTCRKGAGAVL